MKKTAKGLRYPEREEFLAFWDTIQASAKEKNSIFYAQAGDGNISFFNGMECEDMWGWLIPENKCQEFEKLWISGNDPFGEWEVYFLLAQYRVIDQKELEIRFGYFDCDKGMYIFV